MEPEHTVPPKPPYYHRIVPSLRRVHCHCIRAHYKRILSATATAFMTIVISPAATTFCMLSNTLTTIILYLQEVTANDLITSLI